MIAEALIAALLVLGALFTLLAAVGALRMPDTFARMSAVSKAAPLGVGLLLIGAALHDGDVHAWTQALLTIVFVAATTPVGAQRLGRAADRAGVPFDPRTTIDPAAALRPAPGDDAAHD
ncbi:MAG: monovalent cation/H(+) antiporter subunit G [Planctomycetes bacterium]|nr:monovalent cation/H(+) antiporter subunit G [Planctomycetota bacterium]